ncbi:hypothetical protein GTA08_BOTSDO11510 [Neofusicoccum parvum]|uniref:Uncharacterized protein n=2 Tax=Neofusicoccum parvum TaxID=310453 RepID=R1EXN7_BOTPV|nr:hypothetical protein UCRNP2_826 [Neofusicoccum parvum UCRNP2]GME23566.1 hypothetical protein GTA08_BOTSDO11510 [Neofusicoccum parvum]GME56501.1 hypothetical protein GTA08_BOTSDO11510 [Neofusicoccum parvum]
MHFQYASIASFALAIGALVPSISAFPLGEPDDSANVTETSIEKRFEVLPEDCQWAQYFVGNIDCYYKWSNGQNFLNYVIQITPTGQDSDGWCEGIRDNIQGECGRRVEISGCNKDWEWKEIRNPETGEIARAHGIDMNFHWDWPWETSDDETQCVTTAIKKATCGASTIWNNGQCYKY